MPDSFSQSHGPAKKSALSRAGLARLATAGLADHSKEATMDAMRHLALGMLPVLAIACTATPPPKWETGGARLMVARAYWERGEHDRIEIREDGGVYEGDDLVFTIDRVGRVVDDDYEPFALMYEDGLVLGPDNLRMGRVGLYNASGPRMDTAWFSIGRDGRVTYYEEDGERHFGGKWYGCNGPMTRTCTLVVHAFLLRIYQSRRRAGPSVGFGIGIGL